MSPLPAHERPHRIIAYIVTTILDAQDRPWEDFGSTTFKMAAIKLVRVAESFPSIRTVNNMFCDALFRFGVNANQSDVIPFVCL